MEYCLRTKNHEKTEVIFTEKQRSKKSSKHPELRDLKFINGRVKQAIQSPEFIYQDLAKPNERRAIYRREYAVNGKIRYTKIILEITKNPFFIITAFRPDYVKERNKTKLLYGQDI